MEYSLLTLLFKNQGKVLTTAVIIREIWGPGYGNDTQALRALMAKAAPQAGKKSGQTAVYPD